MRSAIFALAILASTIKMLAQAPALGPGKAAKPDAALCTVSGRVVTAADGSPLKSARVALMRDHVGSGPRMYAATSDRDGRFNIQDIDPGRYEFLAIRTGYVDQPYQSQGTDSPVLALQAGQQLSDVLFRLKMASVIAGHVSNEDGEGMAHVQVVALRKPSEAEISEEGLPASRKPEPRAVASAQTDDRGQYRIFGLEPGEYYIKATQSFEK